MSGSAGARSVLGTMTNLRVGPDTGLLRPSLKTHVTGMRQALRALEVGTPEVRKYLLEEVNIVYECKVCMNFFRSLANLIAHKRSYCQEKFEGVAHVFDTMAGVEAAQLQTVVVQAEEVDAVCPEADWNIENYSPSLELLKEAGVLREIEERPMVNRLLPVGKKGLDSVVERLAAKAGAEHRAQVSEEARFTDGICLEPIKQTDAAQFQSWTTGFEYQEVQRLNARESTVALAPNGQELPRGDMNGLLKRPASPTTSDSSKENMDEEDNNNMSGLTRYPCPICKKAFSKVGNVYKHLASQHNKSKTEYLKMSKAIRNNAFIDEKENEVEETPPKLHFVKARPPEEAMQLALNLGLVNRQGAGLQRGPGRPPKVKPLDANGQQERGTDFMCDQCGYASVSAKGLAIHMGLGKCKRNVKENLANGVVINSVVNGTPGVNNGANGGYESEDEEVSFSPRLGEKETSDTEETGRPDRKRKRVEVEPLVKESRTSSETAWNDGQFNCQLCDKSFRTPTFLLQHYVSPHFRHELRSEFSAALASKKCCRCSISFDSDAKLMMHLGATHREVIKYLPSGVTLPQSGRSPAKKAAAASTVEDPLQKLIATALSAQQKQQQQQEESESVVGNGGGVPSPAGRQSSRTSSSSQNGTTTSTTTMNTSSPKRQAATAAAAVLKEAANDSGTEPPPIKRSPGRPPGSPNKVKKDKTGSPPTSRPRETTLSEFVCECGFSSASERGLNIHRSLHCAARPKEASGAEMICECGYSTLSERGLNIHRGLNCPARPKENAGCEFSCECGFTSMSERGINIHRSGGKCTVPKTPSASPKQTKTTPKQQKQISPKTGRNLPEIEDEFMA